MKIQELIKENYSIAKSKGFYPEDSTVYDHLMGITEEFGECSTAHRNGKFADWEEYNRIVSIFPEDKEHYKSTFRDYISGSFEDEITDLFIRLLNLAGHYVDPLNYDVIEKNFNNDYLSPVKSVTEFLVKIQYGPIMTIFVDLETGIIPAGEIGRTLKSIYLFCKIKNIPLEKHIYAKMEFNLFRV